ncbi:hypothetical protein LCGC14_1352110 [marine sediment metagenome]|uniref:Uncharacterized protein n=1 Tax=marine sediment metagenome TaxID=412755 RepID=A0A0F9KBA6_9ZZZZ
MKKLDLYLKYRDQIKTGDAIQWKSESVLGYMIRLFERIPANKKNIPGANVNHTALAMIFKEYDKDRRYCTEALEHGIDVNVLSVRFAKYKGKVWWLPLLDRYDTDIIRMAIGSFAMSHVGIGYDYLSIFKQTRRKVAVDKKRLFCSEHYYVSINEAFTDLGIPQRQMLFAPQPNDIPFMGIHKLGVRIF